jgi:metal-dependent hydrolase (beta-lactamase superfamily II)
MERTVRVAIDPTKLGTIDAIYISHSHTDHFDPYTLMQIYQHASPILLLPFTLAYLVPLLREYLGDITIDILYPRKPYILK